MTAPLQQWQDMQEQTLQLLKSQQDTYLAAVQAWRTQLAAGAAAGQTMSGPGQQPQGAPFNPAAFNPVAGSGTSAAAAWAGPGFINPEQVTEANRAYLQKFNDLQQDFLRRLTQLVTDQQT